METPANRFKQALGEGRVLIGLWLALGDPVAAEICAGAGFDWLLIDAEHGPQDIPGVLAQLQAIAAYPASNAVVRVPSADAVAIKEYLDLGAETLLVPMIDSGAEAAAVVDAARYPPQGSRGIGGARAARWGRYPRYVAEANAQVCLIVQVETATGLANLEEIAGCDGVDAVLIGPADLAASLGHPGDVTHPTVQQAIFDALGRIRACGKPAGIMIRDEAMIRRCIDEGAAFVAVGVDTLMLAAATSALAERFGEAAGGSGRS